MRDARADFESRRRLRRALGSRFLTVALLGLAFLVGRAAWGMFQAYREASAAERRAAAELRELEENLVAAEGESASLNSPSGAEKRLRATLNVAAPGEEVIVIVRQAEDSERGDESPSDLWSLWGLLD